MQLEQRDKELTAIGASIGANCRPCIEHHIEAARAAGLSEAELVESVTTARAERDHAIRLLASRIDELLDSRPAAEPTPAVVARSKDQALVALGASVGANSHALLRVNIAGARDAGLDAKELAAAIAMAGYVQQMAAEITAKKATTMLENRDNPAAPSPRNSDTLEEVH